LQTSANNQSLAFQIKKIKLKNISLNYENLASKWTGSLLINGLEGKLKYSDTAARFEVQSGIIVNYLGILEGKESKFFQYKPISLVAELAYNKGSSMLNFKNLDLAIENALFNISGGIQLDSSKILNLQAKGKNTSIQHLISLLPNQITAPLQAYKSEGNVWFTASASGSYSAGKVPEIKVNMGCKDARFTNPSTNTEVRKLNLDFYYSNANSGIVSLKNVSGVIKNHPFIGGLVVNNLKQPILDLTFNGTIPIDILAPWLPKVESGTYNGLAQLTLSYKGPTSNFQNPSVWKKIVFSGDLNLENLTIPSKNKWTQISGLNGHLLFDQKDIAIDNLTGKIGSNQFLIAANLQNIVPSLFDPTKDVFIEADLKSPHLNIDELLGKNEPKKNKETTSSPQSSNESGLTKHLNLKLNIATESLNFNKIKAKEVKCALFINKNGFKIQDFSAKAAQGTIALDLLVDQRNKREIKINGSLQANDISVDSLFFMFDDFGQNYLTHKQIHGLLHGKVSGKFTLDKNGQVVLPSIEVLGKAKLDNGRLQLFEPLMAMSKFFKANDLMNLTFETLENEFTISNNLITIPEMEVKSNILRFSVIGTHTFDQVLDYRVKVPLSNFRKKDKDTQYGEVKKSATSDGNIVLHIYGKEGNLKVVPDKQAIKEQLKKSWKEEKKEFLDLFRRKKETQKQEQEKTPAKEQEFFEF